MNIGRRLGFVACLFLFLLISCAWIVYAVSTDAFAWVAVDSYVVTYAVLFNAAILFAFAPFCRFLALIKCIGTTFEDFGYGFRADSISSAVGYCVLASRASAVCYAHLIIVQSLLVRLDICKMLTN